MKLFRSLFSLFIVIVIAVGLIVTCPTKDAFAEYYVSQNQTGLGGFFDGAFATIVKQRTEEKNYLFFAVFEVDKEDRYVGILGHFIGRSSTEQAAHTLEELIDQAKETLGQK